MKLLLTSKKDKGKDSYFSDRYVMIAMFLAVVPGIYLVFSNLHSLDYALEIRVFMLSTLILGVLLFKKIKNLEITYKTDQFGITWPDNLSRVVLFFLFSVPVSAILVWGALEINQKFDVSPPKRITGNIEKRIRSNILGTFKVKIKPDLPDITRGTTLKIDFDLYKNLDVGSRVILIVRDGALEYPYIAEVKPFKTGETTKGENE
jgi:hypothetical protein